MSTTVEPVSPKLNQVQLHLIEFFSRPMSEQELLDIKDLLVQYYAQKVDQELDKIWVEKEFSPASFRKKTQNLHLRKRKSA